MLVTVIQILVLFAVPIVIHNVLKGKAIARWCSPVVACYVIGISIGSLIVAKLAPNLSQQIIGVSKEVEGLSIVIAIPLLLMTSNFIKWLPKAKHVLGAFCIAWCSVLIGAVSTFFIYKGVTADGWMVSSMLFAGFTGTNANLNALGLAIDCPEDLMLLINLGDIFTGAIYLILLTSVAHPFLSKILPKYQHYSTGLLFVDEELAKDLDQSQENDFNYVLGYKMNKVGTYILPIFLSILTLGISVGLEKLFMPAEGMDPTFIILSVTIIGILWSLIKPIRELKSSYRIGQYLLLVFCIALGSHIDVMEVFKGSTLVLTYTAVLMVITLSVNILLAYIFKIDADTAIITSTSTIFGPAFIGQVAMSMKNKEIVFSGMIASMVGIALGTFFGVALARILEQL